MINVHCPSAKRERPAHYYCCLHHHIVMLSFRNAGWYVWHNAQVSVIPFAILKNGHKKKEEEEILNR